MQITKYTNGYSSMYCAMKACPLNMVCTVTPFLTLSCKTWLSKACIIKSMDVKIEINKVPKAKVLVNL